MRKFIILSLIGLIFWGCSGDVKSTSEQELLNNYLTLHRNKDLEGVLSLFYQKDTPDFVLAAVRRQTMENFKFSISSSEIVEIPAGKRERIMAGYEYKGITLVPNLEPLKQISFKYDMTGQPEKRKASGSSIMFGKHEGTYYFVLSKAKETP